MTALHSIPGDGFELTAKQLTGLRIEADTAIRQALDQCETLKATRSSQVSTSPFGRYLTELDVHEEITAPEGMHPTASTSQVFGKVKGSFKAIARCFASQTRDEFYNAHKRIYSFTADARVLHNVPASEKRSPSISEAVKWAAYELFPLEHGADSYQYEMSGDGIDARGNPYAFYVTIPVVVSEFSELSDNSETVRITTTSVVITRPHKANTSFSDVLMTMHTDFRTSAVHRSLFKRFRLTLQLVHTLVVTRCVVTPWRLERGAWAPAKPPTKCSLCMKAFSMLRGKHSCLVCSRVVCRKCVVKATKVVAAKKSKTSHGSKLAARLCSPCVVQLQETHELEPISLSVTSTSDEDLPHHLRLSETVGKVSVWGDSVVEDWATHDTSIHGMHEPRHSESEVAGWSTTPPACYRKSHSLFAYPSGDLPKPNSNDCTDDGDAFSLFSPSRSIGMCEDDDASVVEKAEDPEAADVLFTVDTSDMMRERRSLVPVKAFQGNNGLLFQDIRASLEEQTSLLNQMRMYAAEWRRHAGIASG